MRKRNLRLALAGGLLSMLAFAFFLAMLLVAPRSTDPVELMRTVGMVSGACGGIGFALVVAGLVGRRP